MKKKIIILGICLVLISGCGKKIPTLSNGEEAVVTFKNGDKISVNDLYGQIKNTLGLQVVITMIDKHILEVEYADDIEDAIENAKTSIETVKAQYGDDALAAIQYYTGYQTFEAYEESMYISYLQGLAIEAYAKGKITDKQIENYYKDEVVGDIKVSHILITPEVTDEMNADEKAEAEKVAKEKAEKIISELKKLSAKDAAAKFAEYAKSDSDDEKSGPEGGNLGYINKDYNGSAYKEFVAEAYKLKDGEYTTKVVKSDVGFHIILRVESKEKAKLETIKDSLIETLANKLLADDATVSIKAMQEIRKSYGFELVDSELSRQYNNYIENALVNAEQKNKDKDK